MEKANRRGSQSRKSAEERDKDNERDGEHRQRDATDEAHASIFVESAVGGEETEKAVFEES